jgi:cardiolipin synthase
MVSTLTSAARWGVDVKIILPGTSDSALVFSAGRSYYTDLLKAGAKLYERRGTILQAKTGVIDGVWSTVGSTNVDLWSFLRNNEVNAVILSKDFAEQMEDMFKQDLADSDQIRLEEWESRPLIDRFKEWFARLFAYWL